MALDTSQLEAGLIAASTAPVDTIERIDALNALAWALRADDVPRANGLATEAHSLSREEGYVLGQARAARTLGMTMLDPDNVIEVFTYAEEAVRLFDKADDASGRAASRDFLSSIHEFIGDLSGAMEMAIDALSIARTLGDPIRIGYALSSVGGTLAEMGETEESVERLQEALRLFQSVGDQRGIGTIASRLSKVLRDVDRTDEALVYAQMCRDAAETTQNPGARHTALSALAELEDRRGNIDEAEQLYREALGNYSTEVDKKLFGARTKLSLGQLLMRKGTLGEAEAELQDALHNVEGNSVSFAVEAEAHEALARLYERKGELEKTVAHLRKAQARRTELSKQITKRRVAHVEARAARDVAKKDAEISSLRKDVARARQLGQYTLERKLGEGGMGVVYRASHSMMRRPTAIKLLPLDKDGDAAARFEREVQMTARLTHPNTITVFDYGRTPDGVFYYAMELLEGANTETVVSVTGPMPAARVIHVMAAVTSALGEAHGIGLVHRDIKPANVFLCKQGGRPDVPKVLDFGLVKEVAGPQSAAVTVAGIVTGTPLYMAPERIIKPDEDDPRSDLYSVGALGYFLLTGEHVFTGANVMEVCGHHLHSTPVPPAERLGRPVPSDLEALILSCLAKTPDQRPKDAAHLVTALEACADNGKWSLHEAVEFWDEYGAALSMDDQPPGPTGLRTIAVDLARSTN